MFVKLMYYVHLHCYVVFSCLYDHSTIYIHSTVGRYADYFQFGDIVNNAPLDNFVRVFFLCTYVCFYIWLISNNGSIGSVEMCLFIIGRWYKMVFQRNCVNLHYHNCKRLSLVCVLTNTWYYYYILSHSEGYAVIAHCASDF